MKKFAAPLQAFALLLLCSGMAWMVFVLATINPTPPTSKDLQARNTQDLSFANMNSTAVALAMEMLAEVVPSPSGPFFLPITGRGTATPVPTMVVTLRPVFILSDTPTPLSYFITATPTRDRPDRPTSTKTPAPTKTLRPATQTATLVPSETKLPTLTPITPTQPPPPSPTDLPTATSMPPTKDPTPTSYP